MPTRTRVTMFTLMVAFVFMMSAICTFPAYADDETPPVQPPEATEPIAPPTQDSVEEETVQTPLEAVPATESVESILAEVPEGTDVVVINEEGEAIPLASDEALQGIITGDPIWCPAGVASPVANANGCSGSYSTLNLLLTTDPIFSSVGPAKDGTIWVASNYAGADNAAININGGTLSTMKNFKLTIKGGWCDGTDVTCIGLVDISKPSVFDVPLLITGWNNDVTLSNITIQNTAAGTNALEVATTRNITLTNIISQNNTGRGAHLHNDVSGTGNVTVTNSQFTGNSGAHGLLIDSNGIITLKDVTASVNFNGYGAYLDNNAASTAKAVILSGTNTFSYNGTSSGSSGLYVTSKGQITVNNLIASNNGFSGFGQGAELYNNIPLFTSGVTLTGTNIFTDNVGNGLSITSFGAIKATNIFANSNGGIGASLFNSLAATSQAVTFTGSNEFKYNGSLGLSISSKGQITLNNVSANSNGNVGAALNNTPSTTAAGITLTGTNYFNDNFYTGTNIQTTGIVLMNNINASGNGASNSTGYGVSISNGGLVNFKSVTLTGSNSFSNNYEDGLVIFSSGVITLNNIIASNNGHGHGARIDNTASGSTKPQAVNLNGTNQFNNNWYIGLQVDSYGAITTNNITANNNGGSGSPTLGSGVFLNNSGASSPQKVTIKGINSFNSNDEDGLYLVSKGAIITNAITATGNGGDGIMLGNDNPAATDTSTVTMTGINLLTGNALYNLHIQSKSTITLGNITASFSTGGTGAFIMNTAGVGKGVTISGVNQFNGNDDFGLYVLSNGLITINMLTANDNGTGGAYGAYLDNTTSTTKAGVTLTGNNTFNGNLAGHGLLIRTLGSVKTNNITANANGGFGVQIDANLVGAVGSVTMSGFNNFNANTNINLHISTLGAVTVNGINSTGSTTADGASIDNAGGTKPVTLTGTNIFSSNASNGLVIFSSSVITTNNLTVTNNGGIGGYFINIGAVTPASINILGINLFDTNAAGGLYVESLGLIKTNNLTASNSANGFGADLNNNFVGSTAGITLTGTNVFNNNNTYGLDVASNGVITVSNVTASLTANGFGASFNNMGGGFATPKAVILSGNNYFNSNRTSGLVIDTYGAVTINNLTASYNGLGLVSGIGADIDNYDSATTTIATGVTLTGNNSFIDNFQQGLKVESFGAIKINNLTASLNGNPGGATLDNRSAPTNAFGVTLTGKSIFDANDGNGLAIDTKGAVLINAIMSTFNTSSGADIDNTHAGNLLPKPVTLTGTNVFSDNMSNGLLISTYGVVAASNVTASNNTGAVGVSVDNSGAAPATPAGVNFTGTNVFNNNINGNGLLINSKGKITLNNITTNSNLFSGLDIINNGAALTTGVMLTGINTFNNNGDNGATIVSTGAVNIAKVTGDENGQSGLVVSTTGAVTLTCGSFNMNNWYGWEIPNTTSLLTIKGVFTAGNGLGDFINNALSTIPVRNCPLP